MSKKAMFVAATACLLVVMQVAVGRAAAEVQLKFGVYTADKPSAVVRQFRPVLNAIERSMSAQHGEPVKIRMQVARSYEEGGDDLVNGKVDFSRFGPASYVAAKRRSPSLSVIASEANNGKKTFNGVICVQKSSPIREVADLKGKRFAFGNERSTIGRYLVQLYLAEKDVKAADLAEYAYLDRHDKVGAAVAAGTYDAGALKESTFKRLVKQGKAIRALATFPNVTKPWIARADLEPQLLEQLRRALLEMRDEKAFKALKKDGFLPATDADYDRIRRSIEQNRLFFGD